MLWNQNGNWTKGSVPESAFKRMQEVVAGGSTLRVLALGPDDGWVLLYDTAGVAYGNVPRGLAKVLDAAHEKRLTIHCVAFAGGKQWICLSSGGWWTNAPSIRRPR